MRVGVFVVDLCQASEGPMLLLLEAGNQLNIETDTQTKEASRLN